MYYPSNSLSPFLICTVLFCREIYTKSLKIYNVDIVQIYNTWLEEQHTEKLTGSWCRQYILNIIYKACDGILKELDDSDLKISITGNRLKHGRPQSSIEVSDNNLLTLNKTLASLGSESLSFNSRIANKPNSD